MSAKHEELRYAHDRGHTDLCFLEDGSKFVTCGTDGDIRIWSTSEQDPVNNYSTGGEWSLSVANKGDKLYVSTDNNDVTIISLENGAKTGVLNRSIAAFNHIAIDKDNEVIALANEAKEVVVIDLKLSQTEIFDQFAGPCLSVSLNAKSHLLAVSSGDTKLRIFDYKTKQLLHERSCFPGTNSFSNGTLLCRTDFEPSRGQHLAYPEKNTIVVLRVSEWSTNIILNCPEVDASYSIVRYSHCGKYVAAASDKGDFVVWNWLNGDVVNVSKHSLSTAVCGLAWNPLETSQIVYTDVEGQLGIMRWSESSASKSEEDARISAVNQLDDEDDENVFSLSKLKQQFGDLETVLSDKDSSRSSTPRPRTPIAPLQPAFMPSSTPEHLDPRYMCWNDIGVIRCYGNASDEAGSKSIEVEFHDATFHNSMMMQNYQDYTMGVLSRAALVVANSNVVHVVPLMASPKEWTLKTEEEVISIAASARLVCFATSNYLVRIASIYGTQRAVVSIPGPVVSMSSFDNVLMVAYHCSGARNGDQCLGVRLIKFDGATMECRDISSALGPESTLLWMGFSDVGTPAMMDSSGMLSMYPRNANIWIPVCDTSQHKKSPDDGFFVTAVFESYGTIGGIRCKGTIYPGFAPRPTVCEIPIEPPFAETGNDKTKMEMDLFAWSTLQISNTEKKFKETAIKTFAVRATRMLAVLPNVPIQTNAIKSTFGNAANIRVALACKNELDERAFELMEMLVDPQITALALKYASKLDKRRLSEKLSHLLEKIKDCAEDAEEKVEEKSNLPVVTSNLPSAKLNRKLGYGTLKRTPKNKPPDRSNELPTTPDVIETTQEEISTPVLDISFDKSVTDSMIKELENREQNANPFLKRLKSSQNDAKGLNPLSLTDKFAGVTYQKEPKENKDKHLEARDKRKLAQLDAEKPTGSESKVKQRKLDLFKFKKNS